jgi:hypothetical protein
VLKPVRILVAAHDWGGLNLLVPLLRAWAADKRFFVEFLGAPVARRSIASQIPDLGFPASSSALTEWLCHRRSELDQLLSRTLQEGSYDLIVCGTSGHALIEKRLFHVARMHKVPSVAFCDMWTAYRERFHDGETWTLPDRLWVIDETMRAAVEAVDWPSRLAVDVIGSPLFGTLVHNRSRSEKSPGRSLRFISEAASATHPEARIDEFELAEMFVSAARMAKFGAPIVIRPHPAEPLEAWRLWVYARRHEGVFLETLPLEPAIADTKLAVGINSILLTELRMCGVPVASIQPRNAGTYHCLPFDDLGIARVADTESLAGWLAAPGDGTPPKTAQVHLHAVETATNLALGLAGTQDPQARI